VIEKINYNKVVASTMNVPSMKSKALTYH